MSGAHAPGDDFGHYQLVDMIGQGGMGEVWRAVDTRKDRVVAVKVLGSWLGATSEHARRFRREADLVGRLASPNIVAIHDYGEIDGSLFIEMPLIGGDDLAGLLTDAPLPPERAARIVAQTGRALAAAHRNGLVHRDVKPSNILVTSNDGEDHVYLIDFGIAHAVGATSLTASGGIVGTLAYMAPERFGGEGDHRSDVYALGCVLFEALAGHPPFTLTDLPGLVNAHLHTPPPLLPTDDERCKRLGSVVVRAMAKEPSDRFQRIGDLVRDVQAAVAAPISDAPRRSSRPTSMTTARPQHHASGRARNETGSAITRRLAEADRVTAEPRRPPPPGLRGVSSTTSHERVMSSGEDPARPRIKVRWPLVAGQVVAGLVSGATTWTGFAYLWAWLPLLAGALTVAAVAATVFAATALGVVDRPGRAAAVAIGLLLAASPALVVWLG